jgi:transglutaminase-like putative cysteine protease
MGSGARQEPERRAERPTQSAGQITWLIVAVGIAGIPHFPFVQAWVPAMVVIISAWRLAAAVRRWHLPATWIRAPLTIAGFTLVMVSYRQISGLDAGSSLLLVMVAMKLLETRGSRDRAIVIFICYFLLFAAFLREQAIWSAGYLLAGVTVTTAGLLQIARSGDVVSLGRALRTASSLVLQALPLTALLFLLFPRIPGPFWALPQVGGQGVTGLSENMTPGDITELALSDRVAFRVRFSSDTPPPPDLYWRGPVLSRFDGRTWKYQRRGPAPAPSQQPDPDARAFDYEITLEPHGRRWLFALETPVEWTAPQAFLTSSYQLMNIAGVDRRLSYRARSHLTGTTPGTPLPGATRTLTYVPEGNNPRTLALARELWAKSADELDYLRRILNMFRREPFYYTLRPTGLGDHAVDEFLFDTREGFCGHFASAFALLARHAGLPSRVVTGYQGGELNPLGDYWIVRQADAHAWTEIWLHGQWFRFDPTAAVAPERIELGVLEAAERGSLAGGELLGNNQFISGLLLTWDAANTAWNRWILAFGPASQSRLLNAIGIDKPSPRDLVIVMSISVALVMVVMGLYYRRHPRRRSDPVFQAYDRLCKRLATAARPRGISEGPAEYANAVAELRPDLQERVTNLFDMYIGLRYDGAGGDQLAQRFIDAVRKFRPRRVSPPSSADKNLAQKG